MKKQASTYYIEEDKPVAKAIADLEGAYDFFGKALWPEMANRPEYQGYAGDLFSALQTFQTVAKLFDDYLINDPQEVADELEMLDTIRDQAANEYYLGRPAPAWLSDILNA